ncbi:dethiobiotin synthase [Aphanothece sacrum]|uniref:ATP-dependent dethiobiotin synthetase BioD n=1 Tax=Aphanothece sacrum FPU1 TaxID=1920663 RepID=A0A401ID12_APHSA|nr:dethiobiotin synthase [Aphanothece sacrum]GBF79131.1 dithiobiotin synthetase [Aphanothece sacrum FPU1]GBF86520.1 dithiobiotin synthetase [Aphanothece sacrum FPU3]
MKTLCIVGTDTEVGKTVLTTAIAAYSQVYYPQRSVGIMKLLQTGVGDREHYQQMFGSYASIEVVAPLVFSTPVAPPIAAEREELPIPLAQVWQALCSLQQTKDLVLVEGLGGLGSPVTWELTVADIAGEWRLPTVLVVPVKLGAIAQAVANVALARQTKVNLKGIILSCINPISDQELVDWAPKELIQSLTYVPVVGILPYLQDLLDVNKLAHITSNLDLEMLF